MVSRATFHYFEQAGIQWCALRQRQSRTDILVDRADAQRIRPLLMQMGFAPLASSEPGVHSLWLRYSVSGNTWVTLAVQTDLAFGLQAHFPAPLADACLQRRWRVGAMWMPNLDDRFWIRLLDTLLGPPGWELYAIQAGVYEAETDGPFARFVDGLCPAGWDSARVLANVRDGDRAALEAFGASLAARWHQATRTTLWRRSVTDRVRQFAAGLPTNRRSLNIAVLGPDGAGKSTLVDGLRQAFCAPVSTFYMGLNEDRVPLVRRIPVRGLHHPIFLMTLWTRYLVARVQQARGRLVIFDRYTYDALLPESRPMSGFMRLTRWARAHALPAPDMVVVLDVPGAVMFARKGEHDPVHLEAERQAFLGLQHQLARLEIVDASQSVDSLQADVMDRIWRRALTLGRKL
jgi:thymidylate kinase